MSRVAVTIAQAVDTLAAAGVASPRADAELLAAHVLGVPRGQLVLADGFTAAQVNRYQQLVRRRAARVPLQHLTGAAAFGPLELAVGPGVFIPRPETELLAQWALARPAALVVDLCSGTGALALAIAHGRPAAKVYAVERDPAALAWLRRNAAQRAAAGDTPVEVVPGDATDPAVLAVLDGAVDLVVCNPPYVPERPPAAVPPAVPGDCSRAVPPAVPGDGSRAVPPAVPPEVADHDPPQAVFAGPDGLAVMRPVVARAAALLRPGGWLGIEHDESHAAAVPALLRGWFEQVEEHRDLTGRPRYATGRRVAD